MPPRYRITLESASPRADYKEAESVLQIMAKAKPGEAESWLTNLPHTLTRSASEPKAQILVDTFSSLGFEITCAPPLPSKKKIRQKGQGEIIPQEFNIPASRPFSHKKGTILTLVIISTIVLSFVTSLFLVMKLIQSQVDPTKEDVTQLLKGGHYAKAKSILLKEIEKSGGTADDYFNLAKARITRIRNLGKKNSWKGHLTSNTWDDNLTELQNYFKSKEGDFALEELKEATLLDPDNFEFQKWLGIIHYKRSELPEAGMAFAKAIALKPGDVEVLNFIALVALDSKDFSMAQKTFKQALQIAPHDKRTLKNMGAFQLYHTKDTSLALRYYQKYMKLNSGMDFERPVIREEITRILWDRYFPTTLVNKLRPKLRFSNFERSRENLTQKLKKKPSEDAFDKLGDVFAGRGLYEEAMIQWNQALKLNEKRFDISKKLVRIQGRLGQFSSAKGTLENAIKKGSREGDFFFALGLLNKYYSEDKPAALKNFKNYLKEGGRWTREAQLEMQELKGE